MTPSPDLSKDVHIILNGKAFIADTVTMVHGPMPGEAIEATFDGTVLPFPFTLSIELTTSDDLSALFTPATPATPSTGPRCTPTAPPYGVPTEPHPLVRHPTAYDPDWTLSLTVSNPGLADPGLACSFPHCAALPATPVARFAQGHWTGDALCEEHLPLIDS